MRFCIVTKLNEKCNKLKELIINALTNKGYTFDENNPDLVFILGGDGTFLRAVNNYFKIDPLFIGINEGNLGFLCEFLMEDINEVINSIDNLSEANIISYPLLQVNINDENILYALNEIRIEGINGNSLMFDIEINDDFLERLNADGICFSTAIGSSGINKGLGGSLVSPDLEVIELSEKTPINNRIYSSLNSPLILDKDSVILLDDFSSSTFNIFYDNYYYLVNNFNGEIEITLSNKTIRILKNEETSYINRLNDSFIREN